MIALITGAGKGIGFETLKYLILKHDVKVIALSRNISRIDELINADDNFSKANVIPVEFNIHKILDNPKLINKIIPEEIVQVDIFINNAGLLINKPFNKLDYNDMLTMYKTNVIAPSVLIRELMPRLGNGRPSHIINISSMGGYQGSAKFPGLSGYSSSKAALACLTECLAEEYKDSDITFNCLALGAVQTEMLGQAFPGYKASVSADEMGEYIADFSVSASKYIRGKIIPISLSVP